MRKRRKALSPAVRKIAAKALAKHFSRSAIKYRACAIGVFVPVQGEIDVLALLDMAHQQFLVPEIRSSSLLFHPLGRPGAWYLNHFGIAEYVGRHAVHARQLDILCLPLVACDSFGHRLGMGGGYYDRTLEYLRFRRRWRRPILIGIGYHWQLVTELPFDSWDIPLDALVTDKGWKIFTARGQSVCRHPLHLAKLQIPNKP